MPIKFEVDHELDALIVCVEGIVNASDFMNSMAEIQIVPGFKRNMNQLVDFRFGSLDLPERNSFELANFFDSASVREKLGWNYKLAFVAARSIDFGQLRMFEAHLAGLSEKGVEIRVFSLLEDASLWLVHSTVTT